MSTAAVRTKPKIKIRPLEDRVVIWPYDDTESMRGRLYIPDTAKEKPQEGEVLAVGPGQRGAGDARDCFSTACTVPILVLRG